MTTCWRRRPPACAPSRPATRRPITFRRATWTWLCCSASDRTSLCEWKGQARYFDIVAEGRTIPDAAWSYPNPTPAFASIRDFIAFYPALMTACYVDGEQAVPQPGRFYGGWITSGFSGPFKGLPGNERW